LTATPTRSPAKMRLSKAGTLPRRPSQKTHSLLPVPRPASITGSVSESLYRPIRIKNWSFCHEQALPCFRCPCRHCKHHRRSPRRCTAHHTAPINMSFAIHCLSSSAITWNLSLARCIRESAIFFSLQIARRSLLLESSKRSPTKIFDAMGASFFPSSTIPGFS